MKATCFFNAVANGGYHTGAKTVQFRNLGAMSQPCGYNKDTGVFTVAIEGLYQLTFHVLPYASGTHVALRIDEQVVCNRYTEQSKRDPVSCSTIQQLRIGQKVDVLLSHGNIFWAFFNEDNIFNGVLLK